MVHYEDIRHGRHCLSSLHIHLVFVTKYRRGVLCPEMLDALVPVCSKVCEGFGADLEALDGDDDHVHLLVGYPPQVPVSRLVNSLKGVSSRILRRDFPALERRLWKGHLWSPSYFCASCGGAPLEQVKAYVEDQRSEGHRSGRPGTRP